ncbi:hypothetical protein P43SY_010706 [Pythium insidiosum]|uniref:Retrotransposon gag domain-containing protein n=1 Tax=Pythium insidiosum TaxID=114742 RepID=A0AAD5L8S0_PYTIN|nr:hypothetical protein P43SY_010706 [Pythium insidiosum]
MPAPAGYAMPIRPFIPHRYLELFDGKRAWWKEFQYLGYSGAWSEPEKCRNLEMYLRGIAETWFQQLGDASKSWPKLPEAFQVEFCAPTESAIESTTFIKTLPDSDVRTALIGRRFASIQEGKIKAV